MSAKALRRPALTGIALAAATILCLALSGFVLVVRLDLVDWLSASFSVERAAILSASPIAFGLGVLTILAWWSYGSFKSSNAAGVLGLTFLITAAGWLIQAFMLIAALNTTQDTLAALNDIRDMGMGDISSEAAGVVRINGVLGNGLMAKVMEQVEAKAPLRTLIINSEGGFADDALALARFVEAQDVAVVVGDHCLSACTLIAAASKRTYAHRYSTFGYHNVYISSPRNSESSQFGLEASAADNWDFLKAHGVPEDIIDKAKTYGPEATLDFSAQAMLDRGLIKGILADDQWAPP